MDLIEIWQLKDEFQGGLQPGQGPVGHVEVRPALHRHLRFDTYLTKSVMYLGCFIFPQKVGVPHFDITNLVRNTAKQIKSQFFWSQNFEQKILGPKKLGKKIR